MEFQRRLIRRWLIMAFILVAAKVVASPVSNIPKALIISNPQVVPIDALDQVVATDHITEGLTTGLNIDLVTASTSEIDTKLGQKIAVAPLKEPESNIKLDAGSTLASSAILDTTANPKQIEHGLTLEHTGHDLKSTGYASDDIDGNPAQQLANTKLVRDPMGYHNYALVCANSKMHTDYCQSGRRGYYCSQNGYVMLQVVSYSYRPK